MTRKTMVLDTSAVIAGLSPGLLDANQVTVKEVLDEARDLYSKLKFETAVLTGKILISEPSKISLGEVRNKVDQTGDTVSNTDIKLLAVALDLKNKESELVTDDYAMQNLASLLEIPYRRVVMPGIKEVLRWEAVCPACGGNYPPNTSRCLICDSQLVRRPKR